MKYTYKHFLTFWFFMVTIQNIQLLFYSDAYLDAFSIIGGKKLNFSTSYKDVMWKGAFTIGYLVISYYLYVLYYIYKVPLKYLIPFNIIWYLLWDIFPILMIDDAYKEWPILIFDAVFAGGIWLLAIPLFNKYYSILKHSIPVLFILYCASILVILYKSYIYNRNGNNNNPLVKFGDKIHLDKILSYIPRIH